MRRFLDGVYQGSGALAAFFLAAICIIATAQVAGTILDNLFKWMTGAPIGLGIPSYADFGGLFLAATTFFALAYTFRSGSHIRVTLLIQRLTGKRRLAVELWCVFAASCFSAYVTYYMGTLVFDSVEFGDTSHGLVPIKLWIPQLSLLLGMVILTVALIDEYFSILRGNQPNYDRTSDRVMGE